MTRRDRLRFGAGAVLVTTAAAAYRFDHDGVGVTALLVALSVLYLAIAFGPLWRGVRPRAIWLPETLAGLCLLASLVGNVWVVHLGPFDGKDIAYFTGYSLLVLWLVRVARFVGRGGRRGATLDAAAATVATALALWVATLAPVADGEELVWGLVWTVYPVVDILLLALAVYLRRRLDRPVRALTWLVVGLSLQFLLDTVTSVAALFPRFGLDQRLILCGFLFSLFALATAACHPSVVDLTRPNVATTRRSRRPRPTLLMFALLPPILSTLVPATGTIDIAARAVLLTLLLVIVFARLIVTLDAVDRARADSHHRATHDALTGLVNRAALLDFLEHRLVKDAARERSTAVLFLDCDDFKHVNDTWGHSAGDTLLRDVADRLRSCTGPADLVARHGGDEFVVDLRSGSYRQLGPVPGAVTVRVETERADGTRQVVSHFNKHHKGLLARVLATSRAEIDDVASLLRVARRAGMTVERPGNGTGIRSGSVELTMVVPEG